MDSKKEKKSRKSRSGAAPVASSSHQSSRDQSKKNEKENGGSSKNSKRDSSSNAAKTSKTANTSQDSRRPPARQSGNKSEEKKEQGPEDIWIDKTDALDTLDKIVSNPDVTSMITEISVKPGILWFSKYLDWKASPAIQQAICTKLVLFLGSESFLNSIMEREVNDILQSVLKSGFWTNFNRFIRESMIDETFEACFSRMFEAILRKWPADSILHFLKIHKDLSSYSSSTHWSQAHKLFEAIFNHFQETGEVPDAYKPQQPEKKPKVSKFITSIDPPRDEFVYNSEEFIDSPVPKPEENFHELPSLPVRTNPIVNHELGYQSVDDYLDTHWRLLRADALEDIREGIRSYIAAHKQYQMEVLKHQELVSKSRNPALITPPSFKVPRPKGWYLYTDVCLNGFVFASNQINYSFSFQIPGLRRPIEWSRSRRFMPGSLVVLSSDNFNSQIWGVVSSRKPEDLKQNRVLITIDHNSLSRLPLGETFTMLETRAFWTSYHYVLTKLSSLKESDFPFYHYLIKLDKTQNNHLFRGTFDFSTIAKPGIRSIQFERYIQKPLPIFPDDMLQISQRLLELAFNRNQLPNLNDYPEDLTYLDKSQWQALKSILTQKVSIIQGPPGTGKTFVGHKATELLLKQGGISGPILCVCYTNHALDQFLEGVLKFEKNIVRIGGRSKSEVLQKYNLMENEQRTISSRATRRRIAQNWSRKDESRSNVTHMFRELKDLGIFLADFQSFIGPVITKEIFGEKPLSKAASMSRISKWLGLQKEHAKLILEFNSAEQPAADSSDQNVVQEKILDDDDQDQEDVDFQLQAREYDDTIESRDQSFFETSKDSHLSNLLSLLRDVPVLDLQGIDNLKHQLENGVYVAVQAKRSFYKTILMAYEANLHDKILENVYEYEDSAGNISRIHEAQRVENLRQFKVIGMTTTGAAKNMKVLNSLAPKVVIIEEAAEIFEAHTLASLNRAAQKVILIGDHQQLRPKVTHYPLVKRGLDISMFERLILSGMDYVTLEKQHRMHPEISGLVRNIYPTLIDADSTFQREPIRGIENRVFFISHDFPENKGQEEESSSKQNTAEALHIRGLSRYLLVQGYKPEQITIISMYQGQVSLIRELLRSDRDKLTPAISSQLAAIRVCSVDDYQGEENHIIILSLVRSNAEGQIGFLQIANRICVAFSRAQSGLYIFGSANTIKRAYQKNLARLESFDRQLWPKILTSMENRKIIGNTLQLCCEAHKENRSLVKDPEDWKLIPLGGCNEPCRMQMDCGHFCAQTCHARVPHSALKCWKPCIRLHPECEHPCPKICHEDCGDCLVKVPITLPKCGHHIQAECQKLKDRGLEQYLCPLPCERKLSRCGHQCNKMCGQSCQDKCDVKVQFKLRGCNHEITVECYRTQDIKYLDAFPHACNANLPCGHKCIGKCQQCRVSSEHSPCNQPCKKMLPCSHICSGKCGEICPPCPKPCLTACNHGKCHKKCGERCIPCAEKCSRRCIHGACNHICSDLCPEPGSEQAPSSSESGDSMTNEQKKPNSGTGPCDQPCHRKLKCGHACVGLCGELCPPICRVCNPQKSVFGTVAMEIPIEEDDPEERYIRLENCAHIISVACLDQWMSIQEKDGSIKFPECPQCKTPITISRRYPNVIKKRRILLDKIKDKYIKDTFRNDCKNAEATKNEDEKKKLFRSLINRIEAYADTIPMGRSMTKEPLDNNMLLILCYCHIQLGNLDKADQISSHILAKDPNNAQAKAMSKNVAAIVLTQISGALQNEVRPGGWYECRNGHPYAIGECGGAMQESRCPCGAPIGGSSHTLRSDNRHAGHVDGSRHAAWGDAANMQNYDLENLPDG